MKVGAPIEFVWRNDEISDPLGTRPVGNLDKGIVNEPILDTLFAQLTGQPVVAIEVDLQPAG